MRTLFDGHDERCDDALRRQLEDGEELGVHAQHLLEVARERSADLEVRGVELHGRGGDALLHLGGELQRHGERVQQRVHQRQQRGVWTQRERSRRSRGSRG